MLRRIAATKMSGEKMRDQEHAIAAGKNVTCVPHSKISDAEHEVILSRDVEKSLQDFDG